MVLLYLDVLEGDTMSVQSKKSRPKKSKRKPKKSKNKRKRVEYWVPVYRDGMIVAYTAVEL